MAKKSKAITTNTSVELAKALGLQASDGHEWEAQAELLAKLKEIMRTTRFTHEQVAKKAGTSRTRITSILNGNLEHVSTDLLIRIVSSLGYKVNIVISRERSAA